MNSDMVNSFIEATVITCETMCGLRPTRDGAPFLHEGALTADDLIGVLGLSGSVKGAVVMSMPAQLGALVVGKLSGETVAHDSAELMDGFGELLNIIAGAAAAKIKERSIALALPTVMKGHGAVIGKYKDSPWVAIPMAFPGMGGFKLFVSMTDN